jgi:hypothetical protein
MLFKLFTLVTTVALISGCNSSNKEPEQTETPVATTTSPYSSTRLPNGFMGNALSGKHSIYLDSTNGNGVATIKSIADAGEKFSTIASSSKPVTSLGKRVQFTANVKSADVTGWAGLWMRVDPKNMNQNSESLAFDNMQERPIKGTTTWTKYSVVLDVPNVAGNIVYGILLHGNGQIWVDSFDIKIVGNEVPVTDMLMQQKEL